MGYMVGGGGRVGMLLRGWIQFQTEVHPGLLAFLTHPILHGIPKSRSQVGQEEFLLLNITVALFDRGLSLGQSCALSPGMTFRWHLLQMMTNRALQAEPKYYHINSNMLPN